MCAFEKLKVDCPLRGSAVSHESSFAKSSAAENVGAQLHFQRALHVCIVGAEEFSCGCLQGCGQFYRAGFEIYFEYGFDISGLNWLS